MFCTALSLKTLSIFTSIGMRDEDSQTNKVYCKLQTDLHRKCQICGELKCLSRYCELPGTRSGWQQSSCKAADKPIESNRVESCLFELGVTKQFLLFSVILHDSPESVCPSFWPRRQSDSILLDRTRLNFCVCSPNQMSLIGLHLLILYN